MTTPAIPFSKTRGSAMLDLLRGLAALLVCVSHWRNLLFVDYAQTGRAWTALPFYLLTAYGHQAVMVFFVLSGFLIAGSIRRSVARGQWSWGGYAVQRLTRLWVVLVPGLLLCALWDFVGMHSGWAPRLYGGMSGDHILGNVALDYNWAAFGRTLFFLQRITGRSFGSDVALWSVGYEFWYYVMFPLGLFALAAGVKARVRIGLVVLLCGIAAMQSGEMLALFPVWLLGAALTYLPPCRAGVLWRWAATAAYLPIFLAAGHVGQMVGRPGAFTGLISDYAVGWATAALIWVLLSARAQQSGVLWERAGRGMARFSFTLYVTHLPLLTLLTAWAAGDQRWAPDGAHVAAGLGLLAVVIGFAWAVAWATEFRTDDVRRWLAGRVRSAG